MRRHNNLGNRVRSTEQYSLPERQFRTLTEPLKKDKMATSDAIYARFEALEERVAHCYFLLHERFIADPPLAKFWADAAVDELQHSSMLRFCREHGVRATIDVAGDAADHAAMLLNTVEGIVSNPTITIDEAFYASLLVESSELDEAYEKLTRPLAADHGLLYEAVRASLRTHHDRFADAAEQFSTDQAYAEAFRAFGKAEQRVLRKGAP